MNETQRMLVKKIIRLESEIDDIMKTKTGLTSKHIKAKKRQVSYYIKILNEGDKTETP